MLPAVELALNETAVDYPRHATVDALFAAQAARTPAATALIACDRTLAFRELDEQSNRLARRLARLGAGPGMLVGVAIERTSTLVVSLLAILKAGAAYVPLDPQFPVERLALMIEDSGMTTIVTTRATRPRLPLGSAGLVLVDAEDEAIAHESADPVSSAVTAESLAYVLYTSGSTGRPKGVMIEHRNLANFFAGMDRAIGPESSVAPGVWLAVTSISFDISGLELLWTLTRGFTVVLHGDDGTESIASEIARYGVTHLQMTPSLARLLTLDPRAYHALGSLRKMLLGGEAVPAALIRHLRQVFTGSIHNMYGPTETTIWSTTYPVREVDTTVPIGRPIANTQLYLLDAELRPVAQGEAGELFIGGDGVARGYWRRGELTAERFIALPGLAAGRVYRTGDLARLRDDGNIEFLGRADFQIKLRGHRIEPGEIEAALERLDGIRQAVVVLREDREGDKRLVAYVVAGSADIEDALPLRRALERTLPEYMVPSAFVFLPSLPLTSNGKIDRNALLRLPPPAQAAPAAAAQPTSELEFAIVRAWSEALGLINVGIHENFFDLGAHSLNVAEVHARLRQQLGAEIALVDLYQYSTVAALAAHLAGAAQRQQLSDRAQRRRLARMN
ncbi:MAG: non-ribosomal peptide synthetase [Terracidiphilus sp.]